MLRTYSCSQCGISFQRETGCANRTLKTSGGKIFCSKACDGVTRSHNKTLEQKKQEKAAYDREYRRKNAEKIKAEKAAYFKATYDPEKARIERKANMHKHVEYCRQPKYKLYKQQYDRVYRAKKEFGEFYEAGILLAEIEKEVSERSDFTERNAAKGTLNKAQQRKRDYVKSINC